MIKCIYIYICVCALDQLISIRAACRNKRLYTSVISVFYSSYFFSGELPRCFIGKLMDNLEAPNHWLNKGLILTHYSIISKIELSSSSCVVITTFHKENDYAKKTDNDVNHIILNHEIFSHFCLCSLVFFIRNDPLCLMTLTLRWMKLRNLYIYICIYIQSMTDLFSLFGYLQLKIEHFSLSIKPLRLEKYVKNCFRQLFKVIFR